MHILHLPFPRTANKPISNKRVLTLFFFFQSSFTQNALVQINVFLPFSQRETFFVTSRLFSWKTKHKNLSKIWSTKGRICSRGANSFPFEKGDKYQNDRHASGKTWLGIV